VRCDFSVENFYFPTRRSGPVPEVNIFRAQEIASVKADRVKHFMFAKESRTTRPITFGDNVSGKSIRPWDFHNPGD
jgi:hypothetical protein